MSRPVIGVGVPVWHGVDFVGETLQSVLAQRGIVMRVFITVDGADVESERVCTPFARDPRVRLVVQRRRLGWVRNCAVALAGAAEGADFVCLQPHDDLIEPDYLAVLLAAAQDNPQAAVVFSDLGILGTPKKIVQESVAGTPFERQLTLLTRHFDAVAFRGLTRVSALVRVPPMSNNGEDDFACDTVWMARLARVGDLVRVPRALYSKRFHAGSAHAAWSRWPPERMISAWIVHCADMLAEACLVCTSADERRSMVDAARARLVMDGVQFGPFPQVIKDLAPEQTGQMLAAFEQTQAVLRAVQDGAARS